MNRIPRLHRPHIKTFAFREWVSTHLWHIQGLFLGAGFVSITMAIVFWLDGDRTTFWFFMFLASEMLFISQRIGLRRWEKLAREAIALADEVNNTLGRQNQLLDKQNDFIVYQQAQVASVKQERDTYLRTINESTGSTFIPKEDLPN